MPEWAEIRIMSDFINQHRGKVFKSAVKNPVNKQPFNSSLLPKEFRLEAFARGKELQIHHIPVDPTQPNESVQVLTITMGMSGNFVYHEQLSMTKNKWPMLTWYVKTGDRLTTLYGDERLELVDHRRFAKWKFRNWNPDRGPDIVTEHDDFKKLIESGHKSKIKKFNTPLCVILMNQKYFNGIGNYLIAEILGRLNVNPFQNLNQLSKNKLTELLDLCKRIPSEAYYLGGGQLKDWINPNDLTDNVSFKDWMKFYQRFSTCNSVITPTGRNFWYHKKWEKYNRYAETTN